MDDRVRMNTLALAIADAQPEPVLLARGRRPAALEVAGPQLLRLGRLVQPDRLDARRESTWGSGLPPRVGQRGALAVSCARCSPTRRSSRGRSTSATARDRALRAAAHPLLLAAVPARRPGPIRELVTLRARRAGRDRDGALATRSSSSSTRRRAPTTQAVDARARAPASGAGRARRRPTPTARSRCRRGPSQCSSRERHRDRVDDLEASPRPSRKPTNAQMPSRRWTSGAANSVRLVLERPGAARCPTGPSGESPSTYQVLNGRGSPCSSGWQVNTSSHCPSTCAHLRDLELAEARRLGQRRRELPRAHVVAARVGEHAVEQPLARSGRGR